MDADPDKRDHVLQRARDRYQLLAENVTDVIFTLDLNLRYTYCSPSVERLRGYTVEEVMSQTLDEALTPASYELASRVFEEALAEQRDSPRTSFEPQTLELELTRKRGGTVWAEVKVSFLRDEGGDAVGILGVSRDITERRRAEDALRESEARLRAIFDGSRDAIAVMKGWIRIFVNPAYVSLFGYKSADEPVGKPIFDDIAPESRDFVVQLARKRGRGEPVSPLYEEIALRRDGTKFFAEVVVSSYVLKAEEYSCVILRDITGRKQAEAEARLLKHSIDVHYDGAYWIDGNARLVYVNDAACRSLGYERGELIGKPLLEVRPAATPEAMQGVWEQIRKGGYFLGESVHRRKDGSEFPVEIITTYVQFDGRDFACGFARDITEKKKLETQLRQSQKLEAVGTLAGGIAHDFNNILADMVGFTELAKDRAFRGSIQEGYLRRVLDAGMRGRDLVRQMLAFSRNTGQEKEPLQLGSIVRESMKLIRASIPSTIRVRVRGEHESGLVLADPTQMEQILMNLCMNGAHAMREKGGVLDVTLTHFDAREDLIGDRMKPGLYMRLTVRDTGTGMPPEIVEKVFDPFFSTKKPTEGTGLGLFVVQGIVRRHDGYITAESEPGRGSTFTVFLPKVGEGYLKKAHGREVIPTGHERVLFVDDEEALIHIGRDMLQKLGYAVTVKNDATEALELFRSDPGRFDLVITDQTMPDLTGVELCKQLHSINEDVPVILTTGYGDFVEASNAKREGIAGFVMKPFTKGEIARTVRKVLDG